MQLRKTITAGVAVSVWQTDLTELMHVRSADYVAIVWKCVIIAAFARIVLYLRIFIALHVAAVMMNWNCAMAADAVRNVQMISVMIVICVKTVE